MSFSVSPLGLPEVLRVSPARFGDERGFFAEIYKRSALEPAGIRPPVQVNHSRSARGVLRGLHFQREPRAQAKLVSVLRGRIFDVAVDVRSGSPTFGRWVAETLSDEDGGMLFVPAGFAHGFCVLSEVADVVYSTDVEYAPEHESGIVWNDPALAIDWPVAEPTVSPRDSALPRLDAPAGASPAAR